MSDEALFYESARTLARRVREKEISARELLEVHLARIADVNPQLNAIPTLTADAARAAAAEADERQAHGEALGPLHGLPMAHKDLLDTAGVRTTYGSRLFADHVPRRDDPIVVRMRAAGAISIGKTNTPEFGAGSQTFNEVFGPTRNPWNPALTCGGSSGGAAVALAAGMLPLADGSDLGGSLRNPANFCNVVGLRPSLGRVPNASQSMAWSGLSVLGPMAREVGDVALLLSVLAGPDPAAPAALDTPGDVFAAPLERDLRGVRVAWSRDVGGLPVDRRVADALEPGRDVLADLGCEVVDAEPDWTGAHEAFDILRAFTFAFGPTGAIQGEALDVVKDTVRWNIERGRALSGADVGRGETLRTNVYRALRQFLGDFEFLAMPVNQVPPFDVDTPYPTEIDGVAMETYLDWMRSAYYVSVTGLPAISVPCGFTPDGLPVGLQLVGRPRDDFGLLQLAAAFEAANGVGKRRPPVESESA